MQRFYFLILVFFPFTLFAQDGEFRVILCKKLWEGKTPNVSFEVTDEGTPHSIQTTGEFQAEAKDNLNEFFGSLEELKETLSERYCLKPFSADLTVVGDSIHEGKIALGAARRLPLVKNHLLKGPTEIRVSYLKGDSSHMNTLIIPCEERK